MQANKLTTVGLTLAAIIGIGVTVSVRSIEVQTRDARASSTTPARSTRVSTVTNMPTATAPIVHGHTSNFLLSSLHLGLAGRPRAFRYGIDFQDLAEAFGKAGDSSQVATSAEAQVARCPISPPEPTTTERE